MAMNGNDLGDAMRTAIDALSDDDKSDRVKVFHAMGGAVVAYIQANAQVSVNASVAAGIPVQVTSPTLTGATTAPGTATTTTGTIS